MHRHLNDHVIESDDDLCLTDSHEPAASPKPAASHEPAAPHEPADSRELRVPLADPARIASLPEAREAIDEIDAALAVLLERRAAVAGVVQELKPVGGFAGRNPERESQIVAAMAERAPSLGPARLTRIMNAVIEAGLEVAEQRRRPPNGS